MRTTEMERLTQFIDSNRLREFLFDSNLDLIDLDPKVINLLFCLENSKQQLESKIKLMYIKEYYG